MKGIRDWISTQAVSSSLASSRPLSGTGSFFGERPRDDESDNHVQTSHAVAPPVHTDTSCSTPTDMESQNQLTPQQVSVGHSYPLHQSQFERKMDPLSKLEDLQIKFLRLAQRLGHSQNSLLVAKVLYRIHLATLIRADDSDLKRLKLRNDRARTIARQQEASGFPELNFSLRILLLGKTGMGKSATINSIFDQPKTATDAFKPSTDHIQEITGTIGGVKITFIDTPGFLPSATGIMRRNRKIMLSVKRYVKKRPPDMVLYFERLDLVTMHYNDFPLLKLMTEVFGTSIWFNTILVMTNSSTIPEGPSGYTMSYESYVTQCTDLVQHYIHQAISDTKLENPVLLVENHHQCRKNSTGDYILPDGQVWKSQFLLLCISTKVLGDANALLKFQDSIELGPVGGTRLPSLPHLLSSFLRRHLVSNPIEPEREVDELLLSDIEEEDEYDQLPPIRVLTKSQFERLTKSQKKAYLDELDYRETLYLKKQLKEECRKHKEDKLRKENSLIEDNNSDNMASPEVVPLPDMAVPPSFDSDCPVHRYRCLATSDQLMVRPVLDPQGWDHDVGFDGINLETAIEIKKNVFASVNGQMSKDKQVFNIQSESSAAYTRAHGPTYSMGLDVQSSGRDLIYSVHTNTKLRSLKQNTTDLGFSLMSFGNKCYVGAKIEDALLVGKRLKIVANAGQVRGSEQMAYGGSIEAFLRGRDYPIRNDFIGLTLTALSFKKEMVFGGALQSEFRPARGTRLSVNLNINSQKMGQICLKASSSEHLEIALISAFSILKAFMRKVNSEPSDQE